MVADKAAYTATHREELNTKQRAKYDEKLKAQPSITLICANTECSKEFLVTEKWAQAGKKFCSSRCANYSWRETNKEHLAAYKKEKYQENREEHLAYNKLYYEAHRKELLLKDKEYNDNHRDERADYRRGYYINNRDDILIKSSIYYSEHREERIAYNRKHYFENYEESMAYQEKYRNAHRDEMRAKDKAYCKANPGKVRNNLSRYRARKAKAPINDLTVAQWEEILIAYNNRCVYCPDTCWRCRQHKHALTKDHIIPLSKGGAHTARNIVPACRSCNAKKWNRAPLKPVQPLLLTIT